MPTSAPSALHKAVRHSRIASLARDARAITFCGVHGQGPRKISRSKQYRRGTPAPRAGPCFQGGCLQHGGLYHSTSKRAFIGLPVTCICSSIGLLTAVREFPFRRYLSLTFRSSAHRHCNRLLWSKPTMWTTIPQCRDAPPRLSTGQTGFVDISIYIYIWIPRLRSTALPRP